MNWGFNMNHQPVLLNEVLKYLDPQSSQNFIDCTFGWGGHSLEILKRNKPNGRVLGIERDRKVLEILEKERNEKRLILVNNNFSDLEKIVQENEFSSIDGILFDLGLSSWQIEKSGRGFSFMRDEPLLMNTGESEITAQEIINQWPEDRIAGILKEYGEERYARKIARGIYQNRQKKKIKTTSQLVEIIKRAVPINYQRRRIHFATKTFQALRITVNDELTNLEKSLPQALKILNKKGRILIISFHSLEDRIAKNFFRQKAREEELEILIKKPVQPSQEEIELNPRSRSAKLRAAVKN